MVCVKGVCMSRFNGPKYRMLGVLLLLFSSLIQAHPHNWIALNSRFVLDDQAQLISIEQRWEFDVFYSMMTLADVLNEYGSEEAGLPVFASRMIENLASYNYFSVLRLDSQVIQLSSPQRYALVSRQRDQQQVLELQMRFDLEKPLSIEARTLVFSVYDPTYYIAMNHANEHNIVIEGGNASECVLELKFAEPSEDLLDFAQSLDQSQKDTDGLGENFAETALIRCF